MDPLDSNSGAAFRMNVLGTRLASRLLKELIAVQHDNPGEAITMGI